MKRLYLNLKRFDIPASLGGVNRLSPVRSWAKTIIKETKDLLLAFEGEALFVQYYPEMHLLPALEALEEGGTSPVLSIGAQGLAPADICPGKNFGAMTSSLPAAALQAAGIPHVILGHIEERTILQNILQEAGISDPDAVSRHMNHALLRAEERGLQVLFCVGEKAEEADRAEEVLRSQLEIGLKGADPRLTTIAYEPVWAIGPGKTPPDAEFIRKTVRFLKECTGGLPVVYGGGMKKENAAMLRDIEELDGGLIALTRFTGDIGFYPEEYLDIIRCYLRGDKV